MEAVKMKLGDTCWCYVGNHKGKMSKGKIVNIFRLGGWDREHYVVEIPTSVDPLLEVRDAFSVSDSGRKPIGFLRRGNTIIHGEG